MKLKTSDVRWLTKHHLDYIGSTFLYNDNIYRLIYKEKTDYIKLLLDEVLPKLIERRWFVDVHVCNSIELEEYEGCVILEVERVRYYTIVSEWTINMFIDAAKMIYDMEVYLNAMGYHLADPHAFNVTFCGSKPIYIDIGSIVPLSMDDSRKWECYINCWIKPLTLYHDTEICFNTIRVNLAMQTRLIDDVMEDKKIHYDEEMILNILNRTELEKGITIHSEWGNYSDGQIDEEGNITDIRIDFYKEFLSEFNKKNNIRSCTDIGGNAGILDEFFIKKHIFDEVCCVDYSEKAINNGYIRVKENEYVRDRVTFCNRSIWEPFDMLRISSVERLKSDLVIALALTHHLLLTQRLERRTIAELLSQYTNKYCIIEFMPLGLWSGVGEPVNVAPSWYNLDWFADGIKDYLRINWIKELHPNRICCFCEKIK